MKAKDGYGKLTRAALFCMVFGALVALDGCTKKPNEAPVPTATQPKVQAGQEEDQGPAAAKTGGAPTQVDGTVPYPPPRPVVYAELKDSREVNVSWLFNYVNFPGQVNVYEVDPDFSYDLGETRAARKGQPLPFIRPLKMPFRLKLPGQLALALAIENTTDQPWHFFANFHNYLPNENGYGLVVSCVCTNHVFAVPPHSTWYRIVNVRGLKIAKDKSTTVIKHDIVGLTQEEIRKRKIEGSISYPEE